MLALLMFAGCAPTDQADSANAEVQPALDPWMAAAAQRGLPRAMPALEVEVTARVAGPGEPAAWTVQATREIHAEPRTPGCRRAPVVAGESPAADRVELLGPVNSRLRWSAERRAWGGEGPLRWLDPAWSVSDLRWVDEAGAHRAEDAVRFGGVPVPTRVERAREGDVTLSWDPESAAMVSILAIGPAGAMLCEASDGSVELPWWSVPADGGSVLLRSTREYTTAVDGALVRVRATIERVVPLDDPAGTIVDEAPRPGVPQAPPPVRRVARQRVTVG